MESGLREALGSNPQIPPEIRDRIETLTQGPNLMLLTAAVTLPMYAVASMLGALLGLAMFRKKTSPPAQP
jgi:hypothetical protein